MGNEKSDKEREETVIDRFKTWTLLVVCSVVWAGCGEDPEPIPLGEEPSLLELCTDACENIYDGCGLFLVHENGAAMSQRLCRERCEDQGIMRGYEDCIGEVSCGDSGEEMISGCFPEGAQIPECSHLGLWPIELENFEDEVLEIVNQVRSEGANCGSRGSFDPVGPLVMNENLRCAARLHSVDMVERGYFAHESPEGVGPGQRAAEAGYSNASTVGENIAQGQQSPESVMHSWMNSDGHCANIMQAGYDEIGVGVTAQMMWTQKLGRR